MGFRALAREDRRPQVPDHAAKLAQRLPEIFDPSRYPLPKDLPPEYRRMIAEISSIRAIQAGTGCKGVPDVLSGAEPPHTWCYYFQRAQLAVQMGDYKQAARLGDQVQKLGLTPARKYQWLPFLVGYAEAGDLSKARKLLHGIQDDLGDFDAMPKYMQRIMAKIKGEDSAGGRDTRAE